MFVKLLPFFYKITNVSNAVNSIKIAENVQVEPNAKNA